MRIGEWHLDAESNELRRGAESVRLEAKAVEVLRELAARPGRVISRDELLNRVWHGVVVGDDALTQAIIKLRKALGDDAQEPRYIETIPKRGYRLIAKVGEGEELPVIGRESFGPRPGRRVMLAAVAGALAVAALLLYFAVHRSDAPWPLASDAREGTPAGSYPLIAVLPLANLSGDPAREYVSDGLTADLIDGLGRFSGLRVMSWNAVQAYKGRDVTPKSVRDELRARYLVRGSVRQADGTMRVAVELSDAEKGVQLWSDRFDAQGAQVFEVQDQIVRNVVGKLALKLTDIEQGRAFTKPTESAEAYDLVLRARALRKLDQRGANREARALLARAQKMAPDYADAWVTLGEAEWDRAAFGWVEDPEDSVRRSESYARKALETKDPRAHARAHSLLATLRTHVGKPEEALLHASRAIEMNPSDSGTLFRQGHALLVLGRLDEAIATIEGAMRYEPQPGIGPHYQLATAYYLTGRYRDAVTYIDMVRAGRHPGGEMHALRAASLAQLGEMEAARQSAEMVRRFNPLFNADEAGTRLRDPGHAAKLREGLAKAGL